MFLLAHSISLCSYCLHLYLLVTIFLRASQTIPQFPPSMRKNCNLRYLRAPAVPQSHPQWAIFFSATQNLAPDPSKMRDLDLSSIRAVAHTSRLPSHRQSWSRRVAEEEERRRKRMRQCGPRRVGGNERVGREKNKRNGLNDKLTYMSEEILMVKFSSLVRDETF